VKGKSNYTIEFREKVAQEAIDTRNAISVAAKYDLDVKHVYGWVKTLKNKKAANSTKTVKDYEEILRKKDLEIRILQELLKKTTNVLIKE
jgi:transposase-like protein